MEHLGLKGQSLNPIPDWLTLTADFASLASLVASIIVFFKTKAIKTSLMGRVRTPQLRSDLESRAGDLVSHLKQWPKHANEAAGVLARIDALLDNARLKLNGIERKTTDDLSKLVKECRIHQGKDAAGVETRESLWKVSNSIEGCIEALTQLQKDTDQRM